MYPDAADASTAPAYQALMAMEKAEKASNSAPKIKTTSTERTLALSQRIKALDGKMYGAYWCSHCNNQKKEFGVQAFSNIPYIECDKEGENSQNSLCKEKKVGKSYNFLENIYEPSHCNTFFLIRFLDIQHGS